MCRAGTFIQQDKSYYKMQFLECLPKLNLSTYIFPNFCKKRASVVIVAPVLKII